MSVTPDFVGQRYKDTNTGNIWIANSTTPGDWTLELQNMQIRWVPDSIKLSQQAGFFVDSDYGDDLSGITSLTFESTELNSAFILNGAANLQSISFPNLTVQNGADSSYFAMAVKNCPALTSITAPLLAEVWGLLSVAANNLSSVSFPSLAILDYSFLGNNNTNLTTVSIPNCIISNNSNIDFNSCALSAASVNHLLARAVANPAYVAGSIDLRFGTNAAPSGQGIVDKGVLIARGLTVQTN